MTHRNNFNAMLTSEDVNRHELNTLLLKIRDHQGGCLTAFDIQALARLDRLRQLLIRCNACRMIAAAQDVQHIGDMIEASKRDYVRDVSLLATDPVYQTKPAPRPRPAPQDVPVRISQDLTGYHTPLSDYERRTAAEPRYYAPMIDPGDFETHSDADPGL